MLCVIVLNEKSKMLKWRKRRKEKRKKDLDENRNKVIVL